ncbi:MAG: putative sensor signal transduction histidine kinase [Solirubrobacterales bacterium]|nr:putative sensor signal transduction histidine kinase [Solirubrobacterales bacterium]
MVSRTPSLLDLAEEIGGLGSWDWRPQTGKLKWSDNHFRLFGLEPQSVVPSVDLVLSRVHPADRAKVSATIFELEAEGVFSTLEYRILRSDDSIRHLRVTVSVVTRDGDRPQQIVGSVQDITDRRTDERTIAARIAISEALDRWTSLDADAEDLLTAVGEAMDFVFGALMLLDDDRLVARAVWSSGNEAFAAVADSAEGLRRTKGGSSVGRALTSCEPVIAPFVAEERPPSELREAAVSVGVRSTVAIPAVAGGLALAALVFLSLEDIEPTEKLVRSLTGIGHELGHFFNSRRAELERPVLTGREVQVLQLAAEGRTGAAIAQELDVSPATVKRHFEKIYMRLDVSDRAAAVAVGLRRGIIL